MSKLVLIVDDDPDDIEMFCSAVNEIDNKIKCIGESNAEKALQQLSGGQINKPDLIFLDLNMPRLNGKQFLARLKSHHQFADTPVVVYSTSKLKEDAEETKQLGAVHFLTKPSRVEDLRNAVARMLDRKWR